MLSQASAQTFKTLYTFTATDTNGVNADGGGLGGLILSGDTLYGTATAGGSSGWGTVFAIKTNLTGFTNLHNFTGDNDGAYPDYPESGLVLSGNTLYGTTHWGGNSYDSDVQHGSGTLFAVNTDGTGATALYDFGVRTASSSVNADGYWPIGALASLGNTLFGTTELGGTSGCGTLFAINADGTGFTLLHTFTNTNGDGCSGSSLVLSGSTLYGTTGHGGTSGWGTVFAINTDGTGFRTVHNFTTLTYSNSTEVNSDGAYPSRLIMSGDTLYGVTQDGGSSGYGTIFKVLTNGSGFAALHTFTAPAGVSGYTNLDGFHPDALILSGNTLYGTANEGGNSGNGTVFAVSTDGTGFTVLHAFSATPSYTNSDGIRPAGLLLSGNTLYGTTAIGGASGSGTIFSISLPTPPPHLTIAPDGSGGYLISVQGSPNFTCQLQRAPSLTGPWTSSGSQTADDSGFTQFHDLFPPPDRAFYRTVQQQ
jgi:uncharacterized repeat protein (TIGR03803 family)